MTGKFDALFPFRPDSRVGVLLSGGVDSALLALAAKVYFGDHASAFFCDSLLAPDDDRLWAERVAREVGLPLVLVVSNPLDLEEVRRNGPRRCYACRKAMHQRLRAEASRRGIHLLFDGVNADDREAERPGMGAAREDGIRSPLREQGLSKAEIRNLAREAGLSVWDRPSAPCLATRFPTGVSLNQIWIDRVRRGEAALRSQGLSAFRLRFFPPGAAVLEADADEVDRLFGARNEVVSLLREIGFPVAALDLEGLVSGKMNRFQRGERSMS